MKLGGVPQRIELKPETDEEKASLQRMVDGDGLAFWGDSDEFRGGAFIINTSKILSRDKTAVAVAPTAESDSDPARPA